MRALRTFSCPTTILMTLESGVGWWSCAVIICSIFVKGRLCYTQGQKKIKVKIRFKNTNSQEAQQKPQHHCKYINIYMSNQEIKTPSALLLCKLTLSLSIIAFFPWNWCPSKERHDTSICMEKDKRPGSLIGPFNDTPQTDKHTQLVSRVRTERGTESSLVKPICHELLALKHLYISSYIQHSHLPSRGPMYVSESGGRG